MEPSNKANAVCVQLVRPCNSSERVPDSFFFHKMERVINHPLLLGLPYLSIKPKTQSPSRSSKTIPYQAMHTYLPYIRDYLPPPAKTSRVTWQANMDPDLDDECQVIHEFSVVKCCFCYLSTFEFKYTKWFTSSFGDMTQEVLCLS